MGNIFEFVSEGLIFVLEADAKILILLVQWLVWTLRYQRDWLIADSMEQDTEKQIYCVKNMFDVASSLESNVGCYVITKFLSLGRNLNTSYRAFRWTHMAFFFILILPSENILHPQRRHVLLLWNCKVRYPYHRVPSWGPSLNQCAGPGGWRSKPKWMPHRLRYIARN